MNARKLPSGRWQSKVYIGTVDGKKIFVTVTEDTKRECMIKAAKVKEDAEQLAGTRQITVGQAVTKYIDSKRGVLSPATIAGYKKKQETHIDPHPISACLIQQLTNQKVQLWISTIAPGVSAKTVKNAYGLFTAAIRMFNPNIRFAVSMPQGKRYEGYVPTTAEVKTLLEKAKAYDPTLYRACLLAAYATLRRGEVCALTAEDIRGNILHVEKDMVRNEDNEWVIKLPKTKDSVRDIPLPTWIVEEMPKEGRLVDYNPEQISNYFIRLLKNTDLPHFRFHDLRKFSVSLMATKGVSMSSIKEIGGWSNLQTPTQIYIKTLADAHQKEMQEYLTHLDSLKL